MMNADKNKLKFRSSINQALLSKILFWGFLKAAIGLAFLILGGVFLPAAELQMWGFVLFLIGFGFITWGLYPYKKLLALETNPNEITVDDTEIVYFQKKGKRTFSIPLDAIDHAAFFESDDEYGILIHLVPTPKKKVIFFAPSEAGLKLPFGFSKPQDNILFLPYFSKRTFQEVKEIVESYQSPD